jgi:hypothetical protein
VNFHSIRNALGSTFLALAAMLLLSSCGGGGAAGGAPEGNTLRLLPQSATVYAGVPITFSIGGGRAPYQIGSSEPNLLPVPALVKGHSFTVIPGNPGVVDVGLGAGELPRRSVIVSVRDSTGLFLNVDVQVGRNFLTTYGVALTPSNCPATTGPGATTNVACAGGTTAVQLQAIFGGNLHGNEQFRLEVVRGNFSLRHPVTGQVSSSVVLNSDHTGTVLGLIEVPAGVLRQVAVLRVIHIPTGVYADNVFVIDGISLPAQEALTAIPNSFTFTGALTTECGTGFGDFYVFGGVPPFTAVSSNSSIFVTPSQTSSNPGRFTVAASNPTICVTGATVIVTDSLGQRTTVTVDTELGTVEPPDPTPITVSPDTITLICGSSGSVSAIGGNGPLSVTSTHPRVTALISGNVLTVTRPIGDGATIFPTTATISVTDGGAAETLTVTVPANCP